MEKNWFLKRLETALNVVQFIQRFSTGVRCWSRYQGDAAQRLPEQLQGELPGLVEQHHSRQETHSGGC